MENRHGLLVGGVARLSIATAECEEALALMMAVEVGDASPWVPTRLMTWPTSSPRCARGGHAFRKYFTTFQSRGNWPCARAALHQGFRRLKAHPTPAVRMTAAVWPRIPSTYAYFRQDRYSTAEWQAFVQPKELPHLPHSKCAYRRVLRTQRARVQGPTLFFNLPTSGLGPAYAQEHRI